jgi:threonine dehydrogenase-like Zn-dependent dehydrogenase
MSFGAGYLPLEALASEPADVERDGFDLVLECTGSDAVMLDATCWLAARGVMVWLGSTRRPLVQPRNVQRMMRDGILRNHLHLATVNSAPRDFADALTHLAWLHRRFPEPLAALITHRVDSTQALPHYTSRMPQGIKTVVSFQ